MSTKNIIFLVVAIIIVGTVLWSGAGPRQGKVVVDENETIETSITTATTTSPAITITTSQPVTITEPTIKNIKSMTTAIITTNKGVITLELFGALAPKTVENFTKLANAGFYNGTRFHRVIKGFMIQGGDPLSKDMAMQSRWGTGGPGYSFADEIHAENRNVIGTIAMANAGPNTNGSQFFINAGNNNFLDTKHTVFGRVTAGMEVVTVIENTKTVEPGRIDRPVEDMLIQNIEIK